MTNSRYFMAPRCRLIGALLLVGCLASSGSFAAPIPLAIYDAGDNALAWPPAMWGWDDSWDQVGGSDSYGHSITGEDAGGVTAWQINDPGAGGVTPNYYFALPSGGGLNPNYAKARSNGWSMETRAQFVSSDGGANQGLSVFFDNRRYVVLINKDSSKNLLALVQTSPTAYTTLLLRNEALVNEYHDYELRYDSITQLVSFYFDGNHKHTWGGVGSIHENVFAFGSIIPGTGGQANFRETNAYILSPPPTPTQQGDFNDDGIVNLADYSLWRDSLGSTSELAADANGNGRIDTLDYGIWKSNFGRTLPGAASTATADLVPEPASALIGLLAMGALCAQKKRTGLPRWQSDPVNVIGDRRKK